MTVYGLQLVYEFRGFPCQMLELGQPPTSADYTSYATITTTSAVKIFLENISSANASFLYAGLSHTLLPGGQ